MSSHLVLFVHGLGGKPTETWGRFSELIKADPELRAVETRFFGYPTMLWRPPFARRSLPIQTLARALKAQLELRFSQYGQITLVSHSLGGLIARRYLVDEAKRGATLRVRRLILFAVPNNGAGLAAVARYVSFRHSHLKQICKQSDLITDLNEDWHALGLQNRLDIYYVVGGQDRVVDEGSARGFPGNPEVYVFADRGHRDLVKPKDAQDDSYLMLRKCLLSELVSNGGQAAPSARVDAKAETASSLDVNRPRECPLRVEWAPPTSGQELCVRLSHREQVELSVDVEVKALALLDAGREYSVPLDKRVFVGATDAVPALPIAGDLRYEVLRSLSTQFQLCSNKTRGDYGHTARSEPGLWRITFSVAVDGVQYEDQRLHFHWNPDREPRLHAEDEPTSVRNPHTTAEAQSSQSQTLRGPRGRSSEADGQAAKAHEADGKLALYDERTLSYRGYDRGASPNYEPPALSPSTARDEAQLSEPPNRTITRPANRTATRERLLGMRGIVIGLIVFGVSLFKLLSIPPSEDYLRSRTWILDRPNGPPNHLLPMTITFEENGQVSAVGPNGETEEITNERGWNLEPWYLGRALKLIDIESKPSTVFKHCFRRYFVFGRVKCTGEPPQGAHVHTLQERRR